MSQEVFNERSATVIAVAITSQEPKGSFTLSYALDEGTLPKNRGGKLAKFAYLPLSGFFEKAGQVPAETVDTIVEGLNEIIGS